MKKLIIPVFLCLLSINAWALDPSTIEYKVTPITIHFNLDGDMYSYKTDTGSAFFGASSVIIDGQLYIHQKIEYVGLGSVKQVSENSYEWVPENLDFVLVLDVENKKIDRIRFDHPEILTVYTWKDLLKKENTEEANAILKMWE